MVWGVACRCLSPAWRMGQWTEELVHVPTGQGLGLTLWWAASWESGSLGVGVWALLTL